MKRTNLDTWIETTERIPHLTRENLEQLQLHRLNEMLKRLKDRGGFYKDYPEKLDSLTDLRNLPFTTAADLSAYPGKFLLRESLQRDSLRNMPILCRWGNPQRQHIPVAAV